MLEIQPPPEGSPGANNPIYGKARSEYTKALISKGNLGKIRTEESKALMATKKGNPVFIYEENSTKELSLIGSFVSNRKAAKFLNISHGTVSSYLESGKLFSLCA